MTEVVVIEDNPVSWDEARMPEVVPSDVSLAVVPATREVIPYPLLVISCQAETGALEALSYRVRMNRIGVYSVACRQK